MLWLTHYMLLLFAGSPMCCSDWQFPWKDAVTKLDRRTQPTSQAKLVVPFSHRHYSRRVLKHSLLTPQQSPGALLRASEVGRIVASEIVAPIVLSLTAEGVPDDWDVFWSKPRNGCTHAERVSLALEQLGPTYVKFGQALSARPDIIPRALADTLATLQDRMQPFDTVVAKEIIKRNLLSTNAITAAEVMTLVNSLPRKPEAAASIGQVYKGHLPGYGTVAIKVQRPNLHQTVAQDAEMLRAIAAWIESLPGFDGKSQLVAAKLVNAIDEFMTRIFEEMDYRREADNMEKFASLYSYKTGTCKNVKVVVPQVLRHLCTDQILVMEWINGTKLIDLDDDDPQMRADSMEMVKMGVMCTLSQLLDTGVLHADPHSGNLMKADTSSGSKLCYFDFGILSHVPETVRDGLICAVVQLIVARDVDAVAGLFGELQLLPREVLDDPTQRSALSRALKNCFEEVLHFPEKHGTSRTAIPTMRFDKLLGSLSMLVARFQFHLPPYFLNNARALATLEGIARKLDPSFNVLHVLYPYALNRLLRNPSVSSVVEETLLKVMYYPESNRINWACIRRVLDDLALFTGKSKRKVLLDIVTSKGGSRIARRILRDVIVGRMFVKRNSRKQLLRL